MSQGPLPVEPPALAPPAPVVPPPLVTPPVPVAPPALVAPPAPVLPPEVVLPPEAVRPPAEVLPPGPSPPKPPPAPAPPCAPPAGPAPPPRPPTARGHLCSPRAASNLDALAGCAARACDAAAPSSTGVSNTAARCWTPAHARGSAGRRRSGGRAAAQEGRQRDNSRQSKLRFHHICSCGG